KRTLGRQSLVSGKCTVRNENPSYLSLESVLVRQVTLPALKTSSEMKYQSFCTRRVTASLATLGQR
ncbi:Hypothetical predicted protein, partial [Lynx pardinus]